MRAEGAGSAAAGARSRLSWPLLPARRRRRRDQGAQPLESVRLRHGAEVPPALVLGGRALHGQRLSFSTRRS